MVSCPSPVFLDCVMLEDDDIMIFKMSGITHPMTQHHITEDLDAQ